MDNMSDVTPAKIVKENPSPSPSPAPSPAPSPSSAPVSRPKTIKPESKITKDEIIKEEFNKPESDKEGAPDKELETYTNDVDGTKGPYLARRQKIVNSSSNVIDCEENFKLI
jgi:hypothetical protein